MRNLRPGDKVGIHFRDRDGWVKEKTGMVSIYSEPSSDNLYDMWGFVEVVDENNVLIYSGVAQPDYVWLVR